MVEVSKQMINNAMSYVIRNNKRWGRYKMDKKKDFKRLTGLLIKNGFDGVQQSTTSKIKPSFVSGWNGPQENDVITTHNTNFYEIIAIINYCDLWEVFKNTFKIKE
jgi:hypothetical protein